ncbi:baseplate J/gp47 family protein [Conservatibacter flavescens]|uniref:Baseplate J protein n=1 Tax=Conservatibacter flavescens TaxID=28161 RepID=A0A2M8S515_9PAST|nr:baseplate J/gp47 family protein [Conservatibacter flavescens]PJG86223.1 baseplate J protein [Conservatibacter flavescens]
MAFNTPTLEEIRDDILRDHLSLNPQADVSVDSDYYVRASALASCVSGLYSHQKWIVRQAFPDTADSEYLEMHASLRKIYRKNANYAAGTAIATGNDGSVIAEGLQILNGENYYEVTTEAVIQNGTATLNVRSLATGESQNIIKNTVASFMSAPTGVASEVTLQDIGGGTDAESDSELLERLLEAIRNPAAGGTKADFVRWAKSVDGVTSAFVYPYRRGSGTVDIAITSGDGLPSDEVVAATQAYIETVRPVGAKSVLVIKPVIKTVDFEIEVALDSDVTVEEITEEIEAALASYFNSLKPADTLVVSQIEAVISDLIGVVDRNLITPTKNQTIDAMREMGWFKLGQVVVREMS